MSRRRQLYEPAPADIPAVAITHATATPCARGCVTRGRHRPDCTCTLECRDHPGHCTGCRPRPAVTGHLCHGCVTDTIAALDAIPELTIHAAARRDGRLSPTHAGSDPTRRGTPAPPSPSPAWDTADEVIQWAHRLALTCADTHRHQGPFRWRLDGVPARSLTDTIGYIRRHIAWYAIEMPQLIHAESTRMRRSLERVTGRDHLTHRLRHPCPGCGQKALVREDGSNQVACRNRDCRRVWREDEYDWLAHVATA